MMFVSLKDNFSKPGKSQFVVKIVQLCQVFLILLSELRCLSRIAQYVTEADMAVTVEEKCI